MIPLWDKLTDKEREYLLHVHEVVGSPKMPSENLFRMGLVYVDHGYARLTTDGFYLVKANLKAE